ncbi:MAG: hypothetical protein GVY24_03735 [Planctomycetes bacterium]|jgi:hypothetical protein|nr:hypothetical protein [Planctomycetota bacterium]
MTDASPLSTLLPEPVAQRAFLLDLADTNKPLETLCKRHGIAFDQVLDLVDDPATWRRLSNLHRLEALRSAIAVHRYRFHGLIQLVRQVTPTQEGDIAVNDETARKAATDLLKADVRQPLPPGAARHALGTAWSQDKHDEDKPVTLLPDDLPEGQFAYALHEALCGRAVGGEGGKAEKQKDEKAETVNP